MVLSLPEDIVLVILGHLDIKDLLNFRQACSEFYGFSKSHSVWESLLQRCIIEDVPLPGLAGRSLDSVDSRELEGLHRRAVELRRNWHSENPVIKQSFQLESPVCRILRMEVLRGRNHGRFLVSLAKSYGQYGRFLIRCWDLRQEHPVCVAEREFERIGGISFNRTGTENDCIAVLTPREIEIISFVRDATNLNDGFVTSKTISSVPMDSLHYFQDRRIITMDSGGRLFLLHIDHPQIKVEFQHTRDLPVDFVLTDTFILCLKTQTLELYPLLSSITAMPRHIIIPPIFVYQWTWPIGSGAMRLRSLSGGRSGNDPITMFIRFNTAPWPDNTIYQYEIRPNAYFVSSELPSELNVPYEYPPQLLGSIGAPVRLTLHTDLVLGRYGTAVWLDGHTETYYQSARGQRVAGAFARRIVDQGDHPDSHNPEGREAPFVYAHQLAESWTNLTLDEEEGAIFLGHRNGVIDVFKYGT